MSGWATAITAAAAVVGTASSIDAARKQKNQAKDAAKAAQTQADAAAAQADQQYNRANQRAATGNYSTPKDATQGGTMLTGAAGGRPPEPLLSITGVLLVAWALGVPGEPSVTYSAIAAAGINNMSATSLLRAACDFRVSGIATMAIATAAIKAVTAQNPTVNLIPPATFRSASAATRCTS